MSMIISEQIRAARHVLRWSISDLAQKSGVSASTIKRIEAEDGVPSCTQPNLRALRQSLEDSGIEFIGTPEDAPGIRIHPRAQRAE